MGNAMLEAALALRRRGWSIIPMKMQSKKPAVRWKRYQQKLASEATIRQWFDQPGLGIAVVFGKVSGNLISRDFDTLESYHQWAKRQPELAKRLPTVATKRGMHIYAMASESHVADVRFLIGKPDGTGAIAATDGELRCGVGCYSVLPPSRHPAGHHYPGKYRFPTEFCQRSTFLLPIS